MQFKTKWFTNTFIFTNAYRWEIQEVVSGGLCTGKLSEGLTVTKKGAEFEADALAKYLCISQGINTEYQVWRIDRPFAPSVAQGRYIYSETPTAIKK